MTRSPEDFRSSPIAPETFRKKPPHEQAAAILSMPCRNPNMPDHTTADFERALTATASYKPVDTRALYPGSTEKLAARLQEAQEAHVKAADDALTLLAALQKTAHRKALTDVEKDILHTSVDWLAAEHAAAQCDAAAPTEGLKAVPLNRRAQVEQDMKAHQDYAKDLAALLESISALANALEPAGRAH